MDYLPDSWREDVRSHMKKAPLEHGLNFQHQETMTARTPACSRSRPDCPRGGRNRLQMPESAPALSPLVDGLKFLGRGTWAAGPKLHPQPPTRWDGSRSSTIFRARSLVLRKSLRWPHANDE